MKYCVKKFFHFGKRTKEQKRTTYYIAVPCKDKEEAIGVLNDYLNDEIAIIQVESKYTPHVLELSATEKILVYSDDDSIDADNYFEYDYAVYKMIKNLS